MPSHLVLIAAATLALGCTTQQPNPVGETSPPAGDGTGGVTPTGGTPDAGATDANATPMPARADAASDVRPQADAADDVATTPPVTHEEVDAAPPTADALASTDAAESTLDALVAQVPGTRVVFVDCTQTPCTARLSALTLTEMRDLLVAVSGAFHDRISFVVREQLDGFTGRTFQADVVLDTDHPRAVPASEDELLTDPGT